MPIRIEAEFMALEVNGAVIAAARFSQYAATDGNGAWIVSTHPARLFSANQAVTALSLAERLAADLGDGDPHVIAWRKELFLCEPAHPAHDRALAALMCGLISSPVRNAMEAECVAPRKCRLDGLES
jgi:hypothetical protein